MTKQLAANDGSGLNDSLRRSVVRRTLVRDLELRPAPCPLDGTNVLVLFRRV